MRRKDKIDYAKYEFIYRVNNFDYFFFYLLLESGYSKNDFIFTYKNKEWKAYLNKEDRKKLSGFGLKLIENNRRVKKYEKKASGLMKDSIRLFKEIRNKDFSSFSDKDLTRELVDISFFVVKLWGFYLPTEFFYYDEVERKIRERDGTPKYLKNISDNIKKIQKTKYDLRAQINETLFGKHIFYNLLKEISKRIKIKYPFLYYLSYIDIINSLMGKKAILEKCDTYVVGRFSKWRTIGGNKAANLIKKIETLDEKGSGDTLTGKVANRGCYIGKVKIINLDMKLDLLKEIDKMKKGDVLVSGSTGPELILACRKARAIITDEGGITSHAAIVSRELKIPCIIGTKIATKVLKDGDMVEVDAEKGIVRKLKK